MLKNTNGLEKGRKTAPKNLKHFASRCSERNIADFSSELKNMRKENKVDKKNNFVPNK